MVILVVNPEKRKHTTRFISINSIKHADNQ